MQFDNENIDDLSSLFRIIGERVMSHECQSQFHELNNFTMEAISAGVPVVLIDMPEILLRMHLGSQYTLSELEEMFNIVANKINQGKCTQYPPIAAQELFPEVFVKPRDEYVKVLL